MSTYERVTASYRWTADEHSTLQGYILRGSYKVNKRGVVGMFLIVPVISLLLLAYWYFFVSQETGGSWLELIIKYGELFAFCAFMVGFFVIWRTWLMPRWQDSIMRQQFAKRPDRDRMVKITIDANAISWDTEEFSQSTQTWEAYVKVVKAPEGFLFYSPVNTVGWIPNHAFESDDGVEVLSRLVERCATQYEEIT